MSAADKSFTGSIPEIYERYLVPLIFAEYARDLAGRAAEAQPKRVLETAAGTGVVTRALVPLLARDARLVATDLNQAMLNRAAREIKDARVEWHQADALNLPFPDASFDAVVCQFGAMFFPDRVAGYREARRGLKPGGRFFFNVWDALATNDFARIVTETAAVALPKDPPRFLARIPHGYHDVARVEADLRAAGFTSIDIVTLAKTSKAPSPREPALGYCQGTPLRSEIEAHGPECLAAVTERAAVAIAAAYGPGPVAARIQAHVVTAGA